MVPIYLFLTLLGQKTSELENLLAETTAYLNISHPDFGKLAGRIAVCKLHKETDPSLLETIKKLYFYIDKAGKLFSFDPFR